MDNHIQYMKEAIKQAKKAKALEEVPIGAVIVHQDKIIARGYNKRHTKEMTTGHAEIDAINKACKKLGSWRLEECTLYVTLEPCPMCAGAIIQSRIKNVYYGAYDDKNGCHQGVTNLFDVKFSHKVNVTSGILEEECSALIKTFFKELRASK